ncbi:MtrAB system histidine kinase MtrB [Nocardioides zeae]
MATLRLGPRRRLDRPAVGGRGRRGQLAAGGAGAGRPARRPGALRHRGGRDRDGAGSGPARRRLRLRRRQPARARRGAAEPAGRGARLRGARRPLRRRPGQRPHHQRLDLLAGPRPGERAAFLREHFTESTQLAWAWTSLRTAEDGRTTEVPGIVVGTQVQLPADGRPYTLYLLFPMEQEQETLALVTRSVLVADALLVVLIGGVTWLVARQVVTPIRLARKVAERLAAGRLQERLRVSGQDDLARLASSFNQMASNLQRQIQQLEELSRVQRRFVADVSHELRTPLTTVRMAGDMLHDARHDFDAPAGRAAELLQVELDRFERLLGELLEISRYDAGAVALEVEDVDLRDVVERVVRQTATVAATSGVRVDVREPGRPCVCAADGRRIERIVRNLVTNAIDHAESRDVVLTVDADEHSAAIAVRDYGVGLAPGESAMVFNRFWRADPARARTSGGTGLGLSIALEDAHLHGGWLQAWGTPAAAPSSV